LVLVATWLISSPTARAAVPFKLRDGDRVVFVGSTLIERDQSYGYLETALTVRFSDRNITFRNLGWSGDTVFGAARARFGPVAEGYQHLQQHVEALEPTVVFVGYGTNESFEGPSGLPSFLEGLDRLLDMIAKTGARIVLIAPNRQEDLGRPLPDPTKHNSDLKLYVDALRTVADRRDLAFIDLFNKLPTLGRLGNDSQPLTDDGLHLTERGYRAYADTVVQELGLAEPHETLSAEDYERLRRTINTKNLLYFHRWRPQNETYLFGFRKHEQGQNAREVPQFDPLVAKLEAQIAAQRKSIRPAKWDSRGGQTR
jgi:lysophospholipase L1-like esterase